MKRRVYIVVPGIRSSTKDNLAWFVTLGEDIMRRCRKTSPAAIEYRYTTGPLIPKYAEQERARQVSNLVDLWADAGFDVVIVCHSRGAVIASKALCMTAAHISAIHFISGACSSDFAENGVGCAIAKNRLGRAYCYFSRSDSAVGFWARLAQNFNALGYGTLGADGPTNFPAEWRGSRVVEIARNYMEHSDWFSPQNYDATLAAVTVAERQ